MGMNVKTGENVLGLYRAQMDLFADSQTRQGNLIQNAKPLCRLSND
jgi:hypothetical protein